MIFLQGLPANDTLAYPKVLPQSVVSSHSATSFLYLGEVVVHAEAGAKPRIVIVQKPFYIEATCRLSYEALVEAINAC